MDRGVYADGTALQTAMTAALPHSLPPLLQRGRHRRCRKPLTDADEKPQPCRVAETAYMRALVAYRQVFDGIVVNDQIKAAVPADRGPPVCQS